MPTLLACGVCPSFITSHGLFVTCSSGPRSPLAHHFENAAFFFFLFFIPLFQLSGLLALCLDVHLTLLGICFFFFPSGFGSCSHFSLSIKIVPLVSTQSPGISSRFGCLFRDVSQPAQGERKPVPGMCHPVPNARWL